MDPISNHDGLDNFLVCVFVRAFQLVIKYRSADDSLTSQVWRLPLKILLLA
jgi:hypothetical protein